MALSREQLGFALNGCRELPPGDIIGLTSEYGVAVVELNQKYLNSFPSCVEVFLNAGLRPTAHVPHDHKTYHPLSKDDEVRKVSMPNIIKWIEDVHARGVDYFTVHLMDPAPARLDEFWDDAVETAKALGEFAGNLGVRIGFENCYRMVRDGLVAARFFAQVDHPALGLTLDAGHFWSALDLDEYGNLNETQVFLKRTEGIAEMNRLLLEMVDSLQHKILHLHLHDIWETTWQDHHSIGSGVMDYPALLDRLAAMGFNGTMVAEIRPSEQEGLPGIRRSLEYLLKTGMFE